MRYWSLLGLLRVKRKFTLSELLRSYGRTIQEFKGGALVQQRKIHRRVLSIPLKKTFNLLISRGLFAAENDS